MHAQPKAEMRRSLLPALVLALSFALVAGCSSQYSVKLDGDVQGTDRDTPRAVRAGVIEGKEAEAMRQAGAGHLRALTDAKVTVSLKFKGEDKPRAAKTQKVDSRTAAFSFEEKGEASGALAGIVVRVEAPGRHPAEQLFPNPADVPFEAILMAVLDETGPGSSIGTPPADPARPR
jgi:hypothetical protein